MSHLSRTFRVFISSTFGDLKAERNALQESVFPPLRELAAAHGCRFQAVDLRWGVSEEAALDQQTMNICLGEIQRCQKTSPRPNFLILLGNRYGWQPLPSAIPVIEFVQLMPYLPSASRELVLEWYRVDENILPLAWVLQPRRGKFEDYENWAPVEEHLHTALHAAAREANLAEADLVKYSTSATEQEIIHGAFQVVDASQHIFCFAREISDLPADSSTSDFQDLKAGKPDSESATRLQDLKSRLKQVLGDNYHEYASRWQAGKPTTNHLDRLVEDVYHELEGVILREVAALRQEDPFEKEITAHQAFGELRNRHFIGRESIQKQVDGYLLSQNTSPLLLHGAPGSGKSALMAKLAHQATKGFPASAIITRFIGATPASSNGRDLLQGLCDQISRSYGVEQGAMPLDFKDLLNEFPRLLALARQDMPLFIFLDALDQFNPSDQARQLTWLPRELPPHVKIILSTLPGDCLDTLKARLPANNLLEVQSMLPTEAENLLSLWLQEAGRTLQPAQMETILGSFRLSGLPLYLKLAFEESRHWKSFDTAPVLSPDIPGIICQFFNRLSAESSHGSLLVRSSLACLAAAKNGLSEDELLDCLSMDPDILADFLRRSPKSPRVERLPVVVWSRLFYDLEPYLAERSVDGASLLTFYHGQVGEVVARDFPGERKKYHRLLAQYFKSQPLTFQQAGSETPNLRRLSELPYQQAKSADGMGLVETITSYPFMEQKVASFDPFQLLEDYHLIDDLPSPLPEDISAFVDLVRESLQLSLHALVRDAFQLAPHLIGRLKGNPSALLTGLLEQAQSRKSYGWLCPQSHSLKSPGGALIHTLVGHSSWVEGIEVSPDARRLISSADRDMRVWDLESGRQLFTQPENARTLHVSWQEGLVWSSDWKGRFTIWELDTGTIRHTLHDHYEWIETLLFTPDSSRALTASRDGTIKIWDAHSWQLIKSLEGHSAGVSSLVLLPGGRHAVSGGEEPDNSLVVWDLENYSKVNTLQGHTSGVQKCTLFPDGKHLVSTSNNEYIVWELPGCNKLHSNNELFVTLSPDGNYLLAMENGHTIDACLAATGKRAFWTEYTDNHLDSIVVTGDGSRVILGMSMGLSSTTHILNIADGEEITHFLGKFLALSPDDSSAVVEGDRFTLELIDLRTGKAANTFTGHTSRITAALFTDGGTKLVSACTDQTVKLWDIRRKGEASEISGHKYWINSVSTYKNMGLTASQDGSFKLWDLLSATSTEGQFLNIRGVDKIFFTDAGKNAVMVADDYVQVWDLQKNQRVSEMRAASLMEMGIRSFVITPNGKRAVADVDATLSTNLVALDFESGTEITRLSLPMGQSGVVAISPDGHWVAVGSYPSLLLWNLETGTRHSLEGHERHVTAITFSPNSHFLASAAEDGSIKVHAVENQSLHDRLPSHMEKVNDILFKDNDTLFSASADGTIQCWNIPGLKPLFSFTIRDEPKHLSFNPQKNWLLALSRDGLFLWNLNTRQSLGSFIDDSELFAMDSSDVVVCGGKSGGFHILKLIPPQEKQSPPPAKATTPAKKEPPPPPSTPVVPPAAHLVDAEKLEQLGKECLDGGRYDEALVHFTKALAIKPDNLNLLFYQATALTRAGMYEQALTALDNIIDGNLAPGQNLGYAYVGKANALTYLKRYQDSLEWYQKAIQVVDNVRSFWFMQGYTLYCLARYDQALESLHKAQSLSPEDQTAEYIGWSQLNLKKYEQAWETFTKLTGKAPRDILSWYGLGLAARALGKNEQAREYLLKFLGNAGPEHAPHITKVKEILQDLER